MTFIWSALHRFLCGRGRLAREKAASLATSRCNAHQSFSTVQTSDGRFDSCGASRARAPRHTIFVSRLLSALAPNGRILEDVLYPMPQDIASPPIHSTQLD